MANKLAGQLAKYSRAHANYHTSVDESARERALVLMAQVLRDAPSFGFSEAEVTQGAEPPLEARKFTSALAVSDQDTQTEDLEATAALSEIVDMRELRRQGAGDQSIYVYGYRCAPDRIKVGSASGDPIARIAAQINTGTPDRPVAKLFIATHDCRALERVVHGVLRLRGKQVIGGGSEWFLASADEVLDIWQTIASEGIAHP